VVYTRVFDVTHHGGVRAAARNEWRDGGPYNYGGPRSCTYILYRGRRCEFPGGKYDAAKTVMGTVASASSASSSEAREMQQGKRFCGIRRGLSSSAGGRGGNGWGGIYDGKGWVGENISIHQRIVAAWCINVPPTAGKGLGRTQSFNPKGRDVWYVYAARSRDLFRLAEFRTILRAYSDYGNKM